MRGHFTIGIMGVTQKIACHSDVTRGSASVRIRVKMFAPNIFAGGKHNYEANQVRILFKDVFECVSLQNHVILTRET